MNGIPNYMSPLQSKSITQTPNSAKGFINTISGQKPKEEKVFDPLLQTGVSTLSSPPVRPLNTTNLIVGTKTPLTSPRAASTPFTSRNTTVPHNSTSTIKPPSTRVAAVKSMTPNSKTVASRSLPSKGSTPQVRTKNAQQSISSTMRAPATTIFHVNPTPGAKSTAQVAKVNSSSSKAMTQTTKPPRYSMNTVDDSDDVSQKIQPANISTNKSTSSPIVCMDLPKCQLANSPRVNLHKQLQTAQPLGSKSAFATSIDPTRVQSDDAHFLQLQVSTESLSLNSTGDSALNEGMCVASNSELNFTSKTASAHSPRHDDGIVRNHSVTTLRLSDGQDTPYASYIRPPQRPGPSHRPRAFSFDSLNRSGDRSMEVVLLNMPNGINSKNSRVSGNKMSEARSPVIMRECNYNIDSLPDSPVFVSGSSPVLDLSYQSIDDDDDDNKFVRDRNSGVSASTSSIGCEVFLDRTSWSHGKSPARNQIDENRRRVVVDAHAMAYVTQMAAQMSQMSMQRRNQNLNHIDSSVTLSESSLSDTSIALTPHSTHTLESADTTRAPVLTPYKATVSAHNHLSVSKRTPATAVSSTPAHSAAFRTPVSNYIETQVYNREVDDSISGDLCLQDPVARQLLLSDEVEYLKSQSYGGSYGGSIISPTLSEHKNERFFSPVFRSEY